MKVNSGKETILELEKTIDVRASDAKSVDFFIRSTLFCLKLLIVTIAAVGMLQLVGSLFEISFFFFYESEDGYFNLSLPNQVHRIDDPVAGRSHLNKCHTCDSIVCLLFTFVSAILAGTKVKFAMATLLELVAIDTTALISYTEYTLYLVMTIYGFSYSEWWPPIGLTIFLGLQVSMLVVYILYIDTRRFPVKHW